MSPNPGKGYDLEGTVNERGPTRGAAETIAQRLRRDAEGRINTRDYKEGYHEAVRNIMDEMYPTCPHCGRAIERDTVA